MYIDLSWLGYGAGIIVVGYVFGLIVSFMFGIVKRVRT
jgi:hypothetical protein